MNRGRITATFLFARPSFLAVNLLFLALLVPQRVVHAGGVQDLDAKTRRSIREAQMEEFGSGGHRSTSSGQTNKEDGGVVVNDSSTAAGKKKCTVQVGTVVNSHATKGARQENITYVDGNVVNVCQ